MSEGEKDRKREIEQRSRKETRGKGEKGTIKVTLHRAAASVLGRDGTAVSEGGEVGRQRKMEGKKKEERRSKERRICEKKK